MNTVTRYSTTKLDKRYTGIHAFQWRINLHLNSTPEERMVLYRDMRDWCLQTYGTSIEVPHHRLLSLKGHQCNPHWAFWTRKDYYGFYVFLATDRELELFRLKF